MAEAPAQPGAPASRGCDNAGQFVENFGGFAGLFVPYPTSQGERRGIRGPRLWISLWGLPGGQTDNVALTAFFHSA